MTSIVIPAHNQLDYCRQCVESIRLGTQRPYRLILVDNGSTDGVAEYFDTVPDATVVHAATNQGFAGGVNLGMEQAEGHVLLLNSDTIVPQGWLARLEDILEAHADIGAVGPTSNCVSGSQQIETPEFASIDAINAFAAARAQQHGTAVRDVARLVGFCMLIRDTVAAEVGRFDEAYGIGNFEDDDYCMRILRAGYRLCVAEGAFVFHYGSRTFVGMGILDDQWRAVIDRNRRVFEEKWDVAAAERSDAVQQSRQLNRRAHDAWDAGDATEAVRLLKQAVETAPAYELNYNDLGAVLWGLGESARAYGYFERALQLKHDYPEARDNLLHAAEALGKTHEARQFLESVAPQE